MDEDLARLRAAWLDSLRRDPPTRVDVLMLGVTPKFALFPWAADGQLTALDSSEIMIRAVWPGDTANRRALRGDWLHTPFAAESFDLVLCDNGPTLFSPESLAVLGREIRRVLRADGRAVMRNFAPPRVAESVAAVIQAAASGATKNFHAFKIRLLMALQGERSDRGAGLGDAWTKFEAAFPDRASLAARMGCPLETVATIDAYRGRESRYYFHTAPEIATAFRDFDLSVGPAGSYELAECCPVFALAPKP